MNTIRDQEASKSDKLVEGSGSSLSDAILGHDPPIEKAHPGLQPALVFLAYPLVLVAVVCVAAIFFFFTQKNEPESENAPATTHSSTSDETRPQVP